MQVVLLAAATAVMAPETVAATAAVVLGTVVAVAMAAALAMAVEAMEAAVPEMVVAVVTAATAGDPLPSMKKAPSRAPFVLSVGRAIRP
jgi:hypothetical protein